MEVTCEVTEQHRCFRKVRDTLQVPILVVHSKKILCNSTKVSVPNFASVVDPSSRLSQFLDWIPQTGVCIGEVAGDSFKYGC